MWQFLLVSLLSANNGLLAVDVTTLRGEKVVGTLEAATSEELILQTAQGRQVLPAGELLSLLPSDSAESLLPFAVPSATTVQLVDGSQLRATEYTVSGGRATIHLSGGGVARASTKSIQSVRFQKQDPTIHQQWQRILNAERTGDVIVVRKTSEPTENKPLVVVLDHLEGVLGDAEPGTVAFEFDGQTVEVARAKVEGLIYHHARSAPRRKLVCQLVDSSDTRWNVRSLELRESKLKLVTSGGVRFSLPLSRMVKLDYSVANLVYLSQLEPESKKWRPHVFSGVTPPSVTRWFRPRERRSMWLQSQRYEQGLTLHSRTQLTYRLGRGYERFLATVGIDDRFRNEGNVFLRITGDRGVLFESDVRGGDPPLKLDLDIRGVRRLAILVDFGTDRTDRGDHLNLCDARLTK